MRRSAGSIGVCLSCLLGCAGPQPRVSAQLDGYAGLLVSNSPTRQERPEPSREHGGIAFSYAFLVDNQSAIEVTLDFAAATVAAREKPGRIACVALNRRMATLRMPRGQRARVDCRVWLTPEATNEVARGDATVEIQIPVSPTSERIRLFYLLRVEDAS